MNRFKSITYLCAAGGLLIYAVPRLPTGGGYTAEGIFAAVWLSFALLIIAAHLHELLGVEEEKRERVRQIKRMRRWQSERRFASRVKIGKQL